jgi:hypothetical protein
MKYFAIQSCLNEKLIGKYPQVKEFIHHCNVEEESNFIDKFIFEKIKIQPILSNVVLHSVSIQTDFIDVFGDVGFNFGYLISDKFKKVLENFNCYGIQFFKTYIVQQNKNFDNYWQTNIYDFPFQLVDFKKTTFTLKDRDINRNVISNTISFENIDEFNLFVSNIRYPKMISFKDIFFNENMDLDFFSLRYTEGANKGIVSERFKNELLKNEVTGIEFQPIELSINEWLQGGEREKVNGKA